MLYLRIRKPSSQYMFTTFFSLSKGERFRIYSNIWSLRVVGLWHDIITIYSKYWSSQVLWHLKMEEKKRNHRRDRIIVYNVERRKNFQSRKEALLLHALKTHSLSKVIMTIRQKAFDSKDETRSENTERRCLPTRLR